MEQGNQTIKDLADEARAKAIQYYGGAAFAKMCLEFEASLEPDSPCDEEGELGDMGDYEAIAELLSNASPQPALLKRCSYA